MYITSLFEDGCEYYLTVSFSSTQTVLHILMIFLDQIFGNLWKHFIDHFVDDNTCSFQLVCPCNNCMSKSSCNFCG